MSVVDRPGRLPDLRPATSRRALRRARRARRARASSTSPAAAPCSWYELARRGSSSAAGVALPRAADARPPSSRAPRRGPPYSRARHRARRRARACRPGRTGSPPTSHSGGGRRDEAARLRRRRLHRLELRPPARRASTATRSSCSTSSPTPAARRTSHDRRRQRASSHGAIEDPTRVAEAMEGVRRGRQLRRRDARRPLDRRARRVRHARTRIGTYVLLEAARAARRALRPGLDRRGLRLDRGGLVHRGVAARTRPRPTARPRRAPTCSSSSLLPHLRARDADLPRLEQLRARTSTPRS